MADVLYKFVSSPTSVENIVAGRIKFAEIQELNDPNEMLMDIDEKEVSKSLADLRKTGFSDDQYRWLRHQEAILRRLAPQMIAIPLPRDRDSASHQLRHRFYDDGRRLQELHRKTVEVMRAKVGILSLSSTFESFPMWAHYASNASGFVIEFSGLSELFRGDKTGSLNALKPVQYVSQLTGMTFDPATQDRLFFNKHEAWSYEKEWRVIVALSDCDQPKPGLHLLQIPISHVTGVIFGWRSTTDDREAIRQAVLSKNPNVVVSRVQIDRGQISLVTLDSISGGR